MYHATCPGLYANITGFWKSLSIGCKYKVTLECKFLAKMLYTQWCSQTQYVGRAQPGPLTALTERLTVILLEYLYLFNVSIT